MCSNEIPKLDIKCGDLPNFRRIVHVKPYVYEVIDGKRRRVSPFVIKDGLMVDIKKRAIIRRFR